MIKILMFFITCGFVPYVLGMLYTSLVTKKETNVLVNVIFGYVSLWALFQLLVIPCIYLKIKLTTFTYLYVTMVMVLLIWSAIKNYKRVIEAITDNLKLLTKSHWLLWIVIILLFLQEAYVLDCNLGDLDDAFYVATAETAVATDTLMEYNPYTGELYQTIPSRYVLSPFPLFVAVLSKIIGVKPVTMAHTFLPMCLIALAYVIYYMIGCSLFKEKIQRAVFLLLINMAMLFSGYSLYTQGVFLYTRIWQGKAVLTALLLPLLFWWGIRIYNDSISRGEWWMILLTMLSSCFVSSMGIMLSAIMMGIMGISILCLKKDMKTVLKMFCCCLPNIIYAGIYILIR